MAVKKLENNKKQALSEIILLHLASAVDGGFSYRAEKGFRFSGKDIRSLIRSNNKGFKDSIIDLKKFKFIERKKNYDGSILISLTDKGRVRALNMRFKRLSNRKENWDGKWRMIAFDIPDECKKARNALRYRLRMAGFHELQESLLLYPYDCKKEIDDFIIMFKLKKYVRFALLEYIDNQEDIKKLFKIK
jgi:DNA-binding transcriptional regulator PaaX